MKQMSKWVGLAIMVCVLMGGQAIAGNGACNTFQNQVQAKSQFAKGSLERPCQLIINGEPVTISGMVSDALYAGQGLTVNTVTGLITVYGFGPDWYWDKLGVSKPSVGEDVEIDAVQVIFSDGTEKIIAITITIDGDVVELRDENGRPLWRKARRQFQKK